MKKDGRCLKETVFQYQIKVGILSFCINSSRRLKMWFLTPLTSNLREHLNIALFIYIERSISGLQAVTANRVQAL